MSADKFRLDPLLQLYLDRGWPVFPSHREGWSFVQGGFHGASCDERLVLSWQRRWPSAVWSIPTGRPPQGSGLAMVDLDVKNSKDGVADLARLIGSFELPAVPRVRTPSGGWHLWFLAPPNECGTTVGDIGKGWRGPAPGIDIKADRGSCRVPDGSPACRYVWDPEFNLERAILLPLPTVLTPIHVPYEGEESSAPMASGQRPPQAQISAYAKAVVAGTLDRIRKASPGKQHFILNAECHSIGRLAESLGLERKALLEDLVAAGLEMQPEPGKRAWRRHGPDGVERTVVDGLDDGMRKPRTPNLNAPVRARGSPSRR
jgi:hypothetical protein